MRRFARHLFTILSALSLLLGVAVCALWVRTNWAGDWLKYQVLDAAAQRWTGYAIASLNGTLYVSYSPFHFENPGHAEKYARGTEGPGFTHETFPAGHDDQSAFTGSL